MRIVHVIQRYPPAVGGSELWCAALAGRQAAAGDEVQVLTTSALEEDEYWRRPQGGLQRQPLPGREEREGVSIIRCSPLPLAPFGLRLSALPSSDATRALRRTLGALPLAPHAPGLYARLPLLARWADLVHLHALPYPHNYAGYLAARLARTPVCITPFFHPGEPACETPWALGLLTRCDAVFVMTEWERRYLNGRGVPAAKLFVAGCAIAPRGWERPPSKGLAAELARRLGFPRGADLIICVGRKMPQKGTALLLRAAAAIFERHPRARLLVVGPPSPWWQGALDSLPPAVCNRIIDAGAVSEAEKRALLETSRLLVNPSPEESFGLVFLEAWAAGIPVVGCRAGAIPEVVGDGGLLFAPGHSQDLARQVCRLLDDPALAARLAQAGEEQLGLYDDWGRIAARVEDAYRGILTDRLKGNNRD